MPVTKYGGGFYDNRHQITVHAARRILGIVSGVVPRVRSAVDVGCGVGTWLSVLGEMGSTDVLGLDGPWVDRRQLEIPEESFLEHDLNDEIDLDRRFDLALALEVAEHLHARRARALVASLTRLSDFVLFSAAIPGQGGVGHVNEQWPPYWISLFHAQGFVGVDIVRKRIWNDESIPFWYRQNILLFVKSERTGDLKLDNLDDAIPGELYLLTFRRAISPSVRLAMHQLLIAVGQGIRRSFGRGPRSALNSTR